MKIISIIMTAIFLCVFSTIAIAEAPNPDFSWYQKKCDGENPYYKIFNADPMDYFDNSLLTAERAVASLRLRGVQFQFAEHVANDGCMYLGIVMEDGKEFLFYELFSQENATWYVPEYALAHFCTAYFGDTYRYWENEPMDMWEITPDPVY